MKRRHLRIGLCTGGGDCPGLNAVIRAVVRRAVGLGDAEVLGIKDGLTGLMLDGDAGVFGLGIEAVQGVIDRGGTMLGTNNKGSPFRDKKSGAAVTAAIKAGWQRHRLDALIAVGGDGTQNMAKHLASTGLAIVGVPKTIDNDLVGTDETVGFATAVEIAATAGLRLANSAEAHNRIMVLEVMGRDSGHIALHAGLASGAHAVLIPEVPFDYAVLQRRFTDRRALGRDAWLVVVAEGATERGKTQSFKTAATGTKILGGIGHEVARELCKRTGADARVTVLGHVQRGAEPSARDRVLATLLGSHAVDLVVRGRTGRVATIQGGEVTDIPYTQVTMKRRLLELDHELVETAEAVGITLGRKSPYRAAI